MFGQHRAAQGDGLLIALGGLIRLQPARQRLGGVHPHVGVHLAMDILVCDDLHLMIGLAGEDQDACPVLGEVQSVGQKLGHGGAAAA